MTKKQVFELLKFIHDSYPNFEITQSRINTWSSLLKDQNPATVMRKAEKHAMMNKFPPVVAELRTEYAKKTPEQIAHEKEMKAMQERIKSK